MIQDFDFEPEFSSGTLTGYVLMPRELANLKLWLKKGDTGFLPGHAIADLWFLANTEPGEFRHSRGFTVKFKAGWCCWSNKALAERWGWTRAKVEELLQQLEATGMILRHEENQYCTPIELLDYRPNFSIKSGTEIVSDEAATKQPLSSDEAATKQPLSSGSAQRESLEGDDRGERHFREANLPGREEFLAACSMRGIPEWRSVREFNWRDEEPEKRWPRANWQRAVTTLLDRWREEGSPVQPPNFRVVEKNGARRERGEILQQLALAKKNGADGEVASLEKELEAV